MSSHAGNNASSKGLAKRRKNMKKLKMTEKDTKYQFYLHGSSFRKKSKKSQNLILGSNW